VFFGLGGYCHGDVPEARGSSVANTKIQSTPGIPDFMDWNQITASAAVLEAVPQLPLTVLAILVVPAFFAFIIGAAMFSAGSAASTCNHHASNRGDPHHPDRGAAGLYRRHQRHHDLRTLHGWDIRTDHAKFILYFVEVVLLSAASSPRNSSD